MSLYFDERMIGILLQIYGDMKLKVKLSLIFLNYRDEGNNNWISPLNVTSS
jgi:hypothetical protein